MSADTHGNRVFEARFSVIGLLFLVAISVAFCVAGLFFLGLVGDEWRVRDPDLFTVVLGVASIGFFGPLGLWYTGLLTKRGVAVRLDRDGLLDRHYSDETIPWENVRGFRTREVSTSRYGIPMGRQRYFEYRVDPRYRRKITGLRKIASWVQRVIRGPSIRLPHLTLDCTLDELIVALEDVPPVHAKLKRTPWKAKDGFRARKDGRKR